MSEEEYEHEVPVCPICGGMVRAEILPQRRFGDPIRGPWRCDIHGEVTPAWQTVIENDEEEGGR